MGKKYVGTLGKWDFYIASYFGKYQDQEAVAEIQKARYDLITKGRKKNKERSPIDIFCTAINVDHLNKRESNPFDYLNTTYHFFALGNKKADKRQRGKIGSALSCALESEERIDGVKIGLPLENKANPFYPRGYNLDPFRENYEFNGKQGCASERLELYRHFKTINNVGDKAAGLGVYKSCNNEFIVNRLKNQLTPITTWLFCSKPAYYEYIYRPFGAMLIPLLLDSKNKNNTSPSLKDIDVLLPCDNDYKNGLRYNNVKFSYRYPLLIARKYGERIIERWFDYLPLVVDWNKSHAIIKTNPRLKNFPHLSQIAWRIICDYRYNLYHRDQYNRLAGKFAKIITKSNPCVGW